MAAATATIQVRVTPAFKKDLEKIFDDLGLDTTTAIRIFLKRVSKSRGIPFPVNDPTIFLDEAIDDVRHKRNLSKPFKSVDEAIKAALED